jgi:hypothetical protein
MLAITILAGSGTAALAVKLPASSEAAKLLSVVPVRISPFVVLPGGLTMLENERDPEPVAEVTPGPPRAPAITIGDVAGAVKVIGPFKPAEPVPGPPFRKSPVPVSVTVRSTAPPTGLVNVIVPVYASCWIWPLTMLAAAVDLTREKVSRAAMFVAPVPIVPIVTVLEPGNKAELVVSVVVPDAVVPVTVPSPACVNDMIGPALAVLASVSAAKQVKARIPLIGVRIECPLKVVNPRMHA